MSKKQAYGYCFTLNNYTDNDIAALMEYLRVYNEEDCPNWEYENPIFRYICWGFEVGKQNTPHLQGFIMFYNKKTLGAAIEVFSEILGHKRTHLEYSRGTPQQAVTYCEKEGDFVEWGERPQQGRSSWDKIEAAMKDPKSSPHLYNQYQKTYKAIKVKEVLENKTRKLRMVHENDKFDVANATEGAIFIDPEIDTYDMEPTMFLHIPISDHVVKNWYAGYPTKLKRGYELIPVNPQVMYLVYSSENERQYIEKKYLPMLDDDWQEDYSKKAL